MKKDNLLKLRLQMFAEDLPKKEDDPGEEGGNQDEPTVKVAEMKRRIEKEKERYENELAAIKAEQDKAIQEAIEKAKKEATLSGKELEKYREEEAKRKEQSYLDRIAELEREGTRRELKDEAIRTLGEKKLPVNESVLNLVVKDTAEDTLKAIDAISNLVMEIKNESASTTPPRTSGGLGETERATPGDIFRKANILNK